MPVQQLNTESLRRLKDAAQDTSPVDGFTHKFYRYPARFSPSFVRSAIEIFSEPGDLVLDPYMGGGTTLVEALASQRTVIGNDLNSLAVFVTKVKTTPLSERQIAKVQEWVMTYVPAINYHRPILSEADPYSDPRMRNMDLPNSRYIRKALAQSLEMLDYEKSPAVKNFLRCLVLSTAQWALDGRKRQTTINEFRNKLAQNSEVMISGMREFISAGIMYRPVITEGDAGQIHVNRFITKQPKVDLVITSPPYPGVHVLYHRWQIDGRRESPAPYWIAGCSDGQGSSYYNFGNRRDSEQNEYFESSLRTLQSVRKVMQPDGIMVQMIAFNNPDIQLPRYLSNMTEAGFREVRRVGGKNRIWREVPQRKWHANLKGRTHSSREVVLVHKAI